MSKAEDLAKELYPDWEMTGVPYVDGQEESMIRIQRAAYIKGYHQAEKDLELNWEDIKIIGELRLNVALELRRKELESPIEASLKFTSEDMCKEVLKQFKDFKEKGT